WHGPQQTENATTTGGCDVHYPDHTDCPGVWSRMCHMQLAILLLCFFRLLVQVLLEVVFDVADLRAVYDLDAVAFFDDAVRIGGADGVFVDFFDDFQCDAGACGAVVEFFDVALAAASGCEYFCLFTRVDGLDGICVVTSGCLAFPLGDHDTERVVVQEEPSDGDRYDVQEVGLVIGLQHGEQDVVDEAAAECLSDRDVEDVRHHECQSVEDCMDDIEHRCDEQE